MSIRHAATLCLVTAVVLSGCSLLVRAAKGELAPIGVDQLDGPGISARARTLIETKDRAELRRAFTDLTSVYLYKCLDKPTKAPQRGDSDLRVKAGQTLLAAMQRRVATTAHHQDVPIDEEVADLAVQLHKKCSAGKLADNDPAGLFDQAAALATAQGRSQYIAQTVARHQPGLDEAIAKGRSAVKEWIERDCGQDLPALEFCAHLAAHKLASEHRYDVLFASLFNAKPEVGEKVIAELANRVGKDTLVNELRDYLLGGEGALPPLPQALDLAVEFLDHEGKWGNCSEHAATWRRTLAAGDRVATGWALGRIAAEQCHEVDDAIIKALASDDAHIRERAVWAIGELKITKARKHLERLQWKDPYHSQACWCYPVRDEAKQALNKLEVGS